MASRYDDDTRLFHRRGERLPPEDESEDLEEEEEEEETSESTSTTASSSELSGDEVTWVQWFCRQRGNEFFCEVDEAYIKDDFNLTGLSHQVPYYEYALDAVLDIESPNADSLTEEQQEMVDSAAELLYGLIHARYIITSRGLQYMRLKYQSADFGYCPRVLCGGNQPVLPVGQSDNPCHQTVSVYCPLCGDIYAPKSSRAAHLDGAYFGRTFPHLFLMVFPKLVPSRLQTREYIGKIYGFRVYERPLLQDGGRGGGSSGSSGGAAGAGAGAVASASSSRKKRNDGTKASSSTTASTSKAAAAAAPTAAAASSAHTTTTATAAARDTTMRVAHAP